MNQAIQELTSHPAWYKLEKVTKLTYSKREQTDESPYPKFDIPRALVDDDLRNITTHCPYCGNIVHPVRQRLIAKRDGVPFPSGAYISLVCPLTVKAGCSRSNEGKEAVEELEALMKKRIAKL